MKSEDFIFGTWPVLEAIRNGKNFNKILVNRGGVSEQVKEIIDAAREHRIPLQKVPVQKLNSITRKNHQGVIAIMSPIEFTLLDNLIAQVFESGENPLFIMLDEVTDVRNFGAICRTAECVGAHGVIIPDRGGASINSDAVKTSAGALMRLPVSRVSSLLSTMKFMKNSGFQVICCSEKGQDTIYTPNYDLPTLVIMGSEERGIAPDLLEKCDHMAAIPMAGKTSSLNVSVATGVILYEVFRQRTIAQTK